MLAIVRTYTNKKARNSDDSC